MTEVTRSDTWHNTGTTRRYIASSMGLDARPKSARSEPACMLIQEVRYIIRCEALNDANASIMATSLLKMYTPADTMLMIVTGSLIAGLLSETV